MHTGQTFILSWLSVAIFLASAMLAAAPSAAQAQVSPNAMTTQTSSDRGVTLKVTPKSIASSGKRWEFSIALDTHSAELGDDLTQSATLMTGDGHTFKPVSWLGAPPGGHHREGVLVFDVPAQQPGVIELRIDRPGESVPRTFRWQL